MKHLRNLLVSAMVITTALGFGGSFTRRISAGDYVTQTTGSAVALTSGMSRSTEELSEMLGIQVFDTNSLASAKYQQQTENKIKNRSTGITKGPTARLHAGSLPVLSASAAFSAAVITAVGGESAGFDEVTLLSDCDGREDLAADHEAIVDDYLKRLSPPIEPSFTVTRVALSEHTVANGFNDNVFYYGDSVGNFWIGTDVNPGSDDGSSGAIDTIQRINIPELVTAGESGGLRLLNPLPGDCTDDQVTVTGIAVNPVCDLADFGLCGVIGEVVYVSVLDIGGCASSPSGEVFHTRIFAFAFLDVPGGISAVGVLTLLRNPLSNIAGLAVDDDGSLYFSLVDFQNVENGGAVFKVTETPRTVASCGAAPRVNRVITGMPSGLFGGLRLDSALGSSTSPVLTSGGFQLSNFSGPSTTFGNIVALACGPRNTLYAAASASAGSGDSSGPFKAPPLLGSTPSMIISLADCAGIFDSCFQPTLGFPGSLPIADGIADVVESGLTLNPGVNNFRIFAQAPSLSRLPVLRVNMQIDFTIYGGIAVDEEGTVYVVSGGTPAGVGLDPSPLLGEILSFPDNCPADRRADSIDLRGDVIPPGTNFGDGDSDRFDHIYRQAPVSLSGTPAGIAGLARGFLRYLNRAAPNAIENLPNGTVQGDDETAGPIIFERFDPSHQIAGGDEQTFPFKGDDGDGLGAPSLNAQSDGGFEFLFGGTNGTAESVWNGLFLNSNGSVSFGKGDADGSPSVPEFRAGLPKLAAAWADMNSGSRAAGFLNTFPVQAMGYANINAFKVRWINVPELNAEACGSSNTFSIYLYDDGTGIDENSSQNADEGPTDLRFRRVGTGFSPRPDKSGQTSFEYGRMDLLGTQEEPVLVGYSIGSLNPITPSIPQINIGNTASDLEKEDFSECLIGTGNEPMIYELFNEGSKPVIGAGGEVIFASPDFDLRSRGNDPRLCTPVNQFNFNHDRATFFVGTPAPSPCVGLPGPVVTINSPGGGADILDINEFVLSGAITTTQEINRVRVLTRGEKGDQTDTDIKPSLRRSPPDIIFEPTLTGALFPGINIVTVRVEDSCGNTGEATVQINFIPPFPRVPSACATGQPASQLINFENLDPGTLVTYQYLASNEVVFPIFNPNSPAVIIDRGGNRALAMQQVLPGHMFPGGLPLVVQFSEPQKQVRFIGGPSTGGSTSGTLKAFNRQNGGELVAENSIRSVGTGGATFTVSSSDRSDIYRVEFAIDSSFPPFIDDLELERECSPKAPADETVDLFIEGIEITQATNTVITPQGQDIQPYSGVPLIKNKYTVVRVYAGVNGATLPLSRVDARLNGFSGERGDFSMGDLEPVDGFGGPIAQPITIRRGVDLGTKRKNIGLSWNFILPLEWTATGPIKLVVNINFSKTIAECNRDACVKNNEFTVAPIPFVETRDITVLPVSITINKGKADERTTLPKSAECTFQDFAPVPFDPFDPNSPADRCPFNTEIIVFQPRFFQRVFPIREGGIAIEPVIGHISRGDSPATNPNFRRDLLNSMKSKFEAAGYIDLPDVPIIPDPPPFEAKAHGFIPGTLYYGLVPATLGGVATRGNGLALGGVGRQIAAAHETGHTIGLAHAAHINGMCTQGSCDKNWPYPHGGIGEFGFDTRKWLVADPDMPPIEPHQHDFMINGGGGWISPRNYCRILSALNGGTSDYCESQKNLSARSSRIDNSPQTNSAFAQSIFPAAEQKPFFMIRGRVNNQGNYNLIPIYNLIPNVEPPPSQDVGGLTLELQGSAGQILLAHKFDLPEIEIEDEPAKGDFLQLVPFNPNVVRVVLKRGNEVLATRARSPKPPSVRLIAPNGGELWASGGKQIITWNGADSDSGDSLLYMVQYSWDAGLTWLTLGVDLVETNLEVDLAELPGGDEALVRVLATDGLNTAVDQSDAFFKVGKKLPEILILDAPATGVVFDNVPRSLIAVGTDTENGALPDEAFTWSIDNGRASVSGRYLSLQTLSLGEHTIELSAKDSDGNIATSRLPGPINVIRGRIPATRCCTPGIICPDDIIAVADPALNSVVVDYPAPGISGEAASVICSPSSGASFPVGTTRVSCIATGINGSVTKCAFQVTVLLPAPIICPGDITVPAQPGQSSVIVNYPPPVVNIPQNAMVMCVPASGSSFPIGTTVVTCTATGNGDTESCSFSITVIQQVNAGVLCLQDDGGREILSINPATGDYMFTNCNGFTIQGTGTVIRRGGTLTLQHSEPGHTVLARIDENARRGTASILIRSPHRSFTIIDRDTSDNTCTCN